MSKKAKKSSSQLQQDGISSYIDRRRVQSIIIKKLLAEIELKPRAIETDLNLQDQSNCQFVRHENENDDPEFL